MEVIDIFIKYFIKFLTIWVLFKYFFANEALLLNIYQFQKI